MDDSQTELRAQWAIAAVERAHWATRSAAQLAQDSVSRRLLEQAEAACDAARKAQAARLAELRAQD